jgi:hypothetical protein
MRSLVICTAYSEYFSGDKIEKNEMGGTSIAYGGDERRIQGLSEGKRQLGRPRPRWEDNIKMDLQEMSCGVMDWIELA